jgi:sialate O-acetylesterase
MISQLKINRSRYRQQFKETLLHFCYSIAALLIYSTPGRAQKPISSLKLPSLFSDHMVLQQQSRVNLWGTATPSSTIQVIGSWGSVQTAHADKKGNWHTKLATHSAGGPYTVTIKTNDTTVLIKDVLMGEVWIASGQSNMDIGLRGWPPGDTILNSAAEIAHANYPDIHFLKVPFNVSATPIRNVNAVWKVISPATAGDFSATAYFYALNLYKALRVPIGIIQSSIGGTPVEAWTSRGSLEKLGDFNLALQAEAKGGKISSNSPSVLFNAMVNPLIPYTIKGVIWYQGESNVGRADQYKKLFPLMIKDWREKWQQTLPIYYVQIAPFMYTAPNQKEQSQKLRDAQRYALKLPKTGMVTTLDAGYLKTAHPPYKQVVGQRLSLLALVKTYNNKGVPMGPMFHRASIRQDKIIVKFKYNGGGLVSLVGGLTNFEIAGGDKIYFKADAKIIKDVIVVNSPQIKRPKYVRYAWSDSSAATLFNKEGLPAATFTSEIN